jgi:hypothetical protein
VEEQQFAGRTEPVVDRVSSSHIVVVVEKLGCRLVYLAALEGSRIGCAFLTGTAVVIIVSTKVQQWEVVYETVCPSISPQLWLRCAAISAHNRSKFEVFRAPFSQSPKERDHVRGDVQQSRPLCSRFFLLGCMPINRRRPWCSIAMDRNACAQRLCRSNGRADRTEYVEIDESLHLLELCELVCDVNRQTAGFPCWRRCAAYHCR